MPMAFFTALGFLQCALWQVEKDHGRLWLGLTLFFGAAMAKFEGFIILAVVVSWILLMPSARPSWKGWTGLVRMLAFWLVAALPFIWLRARIPVLHYESGWAGYALRNPWTTVSHWPGILMMILSRWFFSHDFAAWNGESGYLHYVGKWQGFSSLYNHPTLGLAWVNVLMTVALWYTMPARRKLILWMVAVIFSMTAAFSLVFASFVSITNLAQVIEYTEEITAARYLFPMLIAWSVTSLTLLFASQFAESTVPEAGTTLTGKANPAPVRPKNKSSLPVAKK